MASDEPRYHTYHYDNADYNNYRHSTHHHKWVLPVVVAAVVLFTVVVIMGVVFICHRRRRDVEMSTTRPPFWFAVLCLCFKMVSRLSPSSFYLYLSFTFFSFRLTAISWMK